MAGDRLARFLQNFLFAKADDSLGRPFCENPPSRGRRGTKEKGFITCERFAFAIKYRAWERRAARMEPEGSGLKWRNGKESVVSGSPWCGWAWRLTRFFRSGGRKKPAGPRGWGGLRFRSVRISKNYARNPRLYEAGRKGALAFHTPDFRRNA